jgi:glycosyltransferase involved in cell wall biosynthesis
MIPPETVAIPHDLRVLFVHRWGAIMAGGEVWITNLARCLTARGVAITAALQIRGPLYAALADLGVAVRPVELAYLQATPRRAVVSSGAGVLRSALRLRALVGASGARLIHAFSPEAAQAALIAARLARVPLVVTIMNCGPYPPFDRQILRRSDRVLAVSRAVEGDLLALGIRPERIACIPSGIDFAHLDRAGSGTLRRELGLPAGTPLIGMVATLEPKKAQDVLLRAIPAVLETFPEARFVLLGTDHATTAAAAGPYEAELRRLAHALQIADHVHFLGHRPEAAALLGDLDVSVLCSRKEALGLAAVESLAAGVPFVASAVEGLREVVADGVTGLLVPPDDPPALAAGIAGLLGDRALARRLGAAGRRDVRDRFDADRLALRNLAVYEALLARRDERPGWSPGRRARDHATSIGDGGYPPTSKGA